MNGEDISGKTPFMNAYNNGHNHVVKWQNIDLNSKDTRE